MSFDRIPQHVAIIMDGNGRWAKKKHLPRIAGHKVGVEVARKITEYCAKKKIKILTLFVFGAENWRRPEEEVSYLLHLFMTMLKRDAKKLHEQNIQLRVIGDCSRFEKKLQREIGKVEKMTAENTGLTLLLAANYSGQWDITQATQKIAESVLQGQMTVNEITPELIKSKLSFADLPDPELFIRTSGVVRISNFMLWQLAYTELYFTETFWPDFNEQEFEKALQFFSSCERRFGFTSEQLNKEGAHA